MKKVLNNNWTLLIALVITISSCNKAKEDDEGLPFFNSYEFTPEWISPDSPEYINIHTIPDFSFTNQNGKIITKETVDGKIYVANFFFTSCGSICPKMTDNMGIIQEKFKDDNSVLLLSHTVAPEIDKVPILKEYANEKGCISGKWHLLTGDKEALYSIAKKNILPEILLDISGRRMIFYTLKILS